DKYRIQALVKILRCNGLSEKQRHAAQVMLKDKCRIYANGCRKRGRVEEAAHYLALHRLYS
ncbi:MAG: glycosyltransferase family 2 protein, partial [Desulfobacteraceae bacterium]